MMNKLVICHFMMTSSNGTIFRLTGPLCGEFTSPGEFPTQRPATRSFDVFFDLRLNKQLSEQPWGWWFETPPWSLWRQCNASAKCQQWNYILQWVHSVLSKEHDHSFHNTNFCLKRALALPCGLPSVTGGLNWDKAVKLSSSEQHHSCNAIYGIEWALLEVSESVTVDKWYSQ